MSKRIILVGKAASGKDFLRKKFEDRGFKYAISYTTRPPREGEIHGKDYFFMTRPQAQDMIDTGEFYEWVAFNNWIYGTTVDQFEKDDVFIMTPTGLAHLSDEARKESLVIFFDIDEEIRRKRMLGRNMPGDSVERRLEADRKDFENFTNYDIKITNHDF
ncbi:Gmk Guanylate kinase [uncultured Caudovirales phage]|uniref:Gmk Guanylate kinase n=1 Tax=uncultured Caudovirales phage TaxID=2100421 RepID=A0A6J5SUY9_9CAUD|nr:Gmk Guanylate kinase [uncultured Caudovirales phage]